MTQEAAQMQRPSVEPRKPSKGEQAFDWLVYGGIAGVGTFLLTIPLAYAMKYKGGDRWLGKQLTKAKIDPNGVAGTAINVTSLMHGGNVLAVPVYLAEKDREEIVDKLNKAMGDTTPKSEIEPKPKQTILSVFTSRITAWLTVFAGWITMETLFPKSFQTFQDEVGRGLAKLTGKGQYKDNVPKELLAREQTVLSKMAELEHSPLKGKELKDAMAPLKQTLKQIQVGTDEVKGLQHYETRRFRFGKLGALDVFATAAAATLFFIGNNFFGKLFNEKKEEALVTEPRKKVPIQNPTLPRADAVAEGERKSDFAERIKHEKEQAAMQENAHAV